MFSKAFEKVTKFTQPVVICVRFFSGRVDCSVGTFMVVNADGWILTAGHVMELGFKAERDAVEIKAYQDQVAAIKRTPGLSPREQDRRVSRLKSNPDWITNWSYWWGRDGVVLDHGAVDHLADLAIGQLRPFDPAWFQEYPVFKDPSTPMPVGTSLCKLGYPFHAVNAHFDAHTQGFVLEQGSLPLPWFPLDGIHTRVKRLQDASTQRVCEFIEMSSPGLRGQSGGPIFDSDGVVWGMQSHTDHLLLGFSPIVKQGNREVTENQFLNVGQGVHVKEILRAAKDNGARLELSSGTPAPQPAPQPVPDSR